MRLIENIFIAQPLYMIMLEIIGMHAVWTYFMFLLHGKRRRYVAAAGVVLSLILIVRFTLAGRTRGGGELILMPFMTVVNAATYPEYYRSAILNAILFLPLGLSLPFALPPRFGRRVPVTVLTGMLLSVSVEAIQFFFALGICETDDVIINTFGAFLGATSWWACAGLERLIRNRRSTR